MPDLVHVDGQIISLMELADRVQKGELIESYDPVAMGTLVHPDESTFQAFIKSFLMTMNPTWSTMELFIDREILPLTRTLSAQMASALATAPPGYVVDATPVEQLERLKSYGHRPEPLPDLPGVGMSTEVPPADATVVGRPAPGNSDEEE